jgi:Nif-specific regulatory protein
MYNDYKRLGDNQKRLLETMPEMVLLVHDSGVREYTNPHATQFFEQCEQQLGEEQLQLELKLLVETLLDKGEVSRPRQAKINNQLFECHLAPFSGYNGDYLFWLILKPQESLENQLPDVRSRMPINNTIVGSSEVMTSLQSMVGRIAKTDTTVLITGESGTGKELIANLIRKNSNRADKPFLTINCNTINDLLLESDLFGYEKGAFTGAQSRKKGKFEVVDGGTIFLDEIGDISPRMQAVLLRVIQYGEIFRVGGTAPINVDVRVIAATNRDLVKAVKDGNFRLDLFYRLNIFNIRVPALRERKVDLPELATHFVKKYSKIYERDMNFEEESVISALQSYDWPGNVRELENVIQRAILMNETNTISKEDLIFDMISLDDEPTSFAELIGKFSESPLKGIVDQVEKEVIIHKLGSNRGNVADTAETLNISKAALYEKMKRHEIKAKEHR